jgi:hypothetical protein
MTLDDLYHCETEEALEVQLEALKVYELTTFSNALNFSSEDGIKSEKKEKLKQAITDKIESKKQEQIQYFGNLLSPTLEDHLEQYDPRVPKNPKITHIHQKVLLELLLK